MGLTLVLEAHNIIIHSLCRYIKYNNLSIYKFRPSFFMTHGHVVHIQLHVSCTHNRMAENYTIPNL